METHTDGDNRLPFVSVIIPVLNNPPGIRKCLEALFAQSYPEQKIEVIVIDNGSSDDTPDVVAGYPVRLLFERGVESPYSARNRGLEAGMGDVVAFTDSDCIPDRNWIEKGVEALQRDNADLVGGHVAFYYSDPPTAAEIFDSVTNLEVKNNVEEKGVAKTGNLFVKRPVFDEIGFFPPEIRSGGDVEWTGRATSEGYKLVYGPEVVIRKKARDTGRLLKKQVRVGYGQPRIWKEQHVSFRDRLRTILIDFRPVSPSTVKKMIANRGRKEFERKLPSLLAVGWLARLAMNLGRLGYLLNPKR